MNMKTLHGYELNGDKMQCIYKWKCIIDVRKKTKEIRKSVDAWEKKGHLRKCMFSV